MVTVLTEPLRETNESIHRKSLKYLVLATAVASVMTIVASHVVHKRDTEMEGRATTPEELRVYD
jgi:hypothetical protein